MPYPNKDESKENFISRFMESDKAKSDFPDEAQRYAVAESIYEEWMEDEMEMDSYVEGKAEQTFDDYPDAAVNNAKRALKYRNESGNPKGCGTPVGWRRANQLANRESLSLSTVKRMAQFKRHQQNKDVPYEEGCGGVMYDAWGGDAGIEWAIRKLNSLEKKSMDTEQLHFHMEIKSVYEEGNYGYVNGWSNVYNKKDLGKSVVVNGSAKKNLTEKGNKRPLNIEHDYMNFLGVIGVTEFEEHEYGLYAKNEINLDTELGREVYARAKHLFKHGLPVPMSIGFKVPKGKDEFKNVDGENVRFIKEMILDHNSIVMKPMNEMSMAVEVKSLGGVLNNFDESSYISVKAVKSLLNEAAQSTSSDEADEQVAVEIKTILETLTNNLKEDVSRIKKTR